MKILFVSCEVENDLRYGLGKSTLPLFEQLKLNGHSVYYFFQGDKFNQEACFLDRLECLLLRLCRFHSGFQETLAIALIRFKMGAKAALLAKVGKYTHVHCSDPIIATAFYFFSLFTLSNRQVAWGFSEHGFGAYVKERPGIVLYPALRYFLRFCEKRSSLSADWVITPSYSGLQQLQQDLNIQCIPNHWHAIYHAKPTLNLFDKEAARKLLGWKSNLIYIVAVGQIIPLKQFPILVEACSELTQNATIQLVILGEGNSSALTQLSEDCGLINPVYVTQTDNIGLYLSASDLYVSISATESFGMANLEAAVAGLPIVCSRVGAVPEIMASCALFCEPEKESLKSAIHTALSSLSVVKSSFPVIDAWPNIMDVSQQYEDVFLAAAVEYAK